MFPERTLIILWHTHKKVFETTLTQALNQGNAVDLIADLTAPENRDLGIVKSPRPKRAKPPLKMSPSPS